VSEGRLGAPQGRLHRLLRQARHHLNLNQLNQLPPNPFFFLLFFGAGLPDGTECFLSTLKQCAPLTINERGRLYAVPALVAPEELPRGVHGWRDGHARDAKVPSAIALDTLVRGRNA
jgi:hypothetical protein